MTKATALRHKLRSLSKDELIEELIGALVRVADLATPQGCCPVAQGAVKPDLENMADRFVSVIQDGIAQGAGSKSISSMIINELLLLRIIAVDTAVPSTQSRTVAHEDCLNCQCQPDERCKP